MHGYNLAYSESLNPSLLITDVKNGMNSFTKELHLIYLINDIRQIRS